jgi:hypothetical protein
MLSALLFGTLHSSRDRRSRSLISGLVAEFVCDDTTEAGSKAWFGGVPDSRRTVRRRRRVSEKERQQKRGDGDGGSGHDQPEDG